MIGMKTKYWNRPISGKEMMMSQSFIGKLRIYDGPSKKQQKANPNIATTNWSLRGNFSPI